MSLSLSDVILGTSSPCGLLIAKAWNWILKHFALRKRLSCRLKAFCHFFLFQLRAYGLESPSLDTDGSPGMGGEPEWSGCWGAARSGCAQASLPPSLCRCLEFSWQVLSASMPSASLPLQMFKPQRVILGQCFQGKEAHPCHNLPVSSHCVWAPAALVQSGKSLLSIMCCHPGKTRWGLTFCFLACSVFEFLAQGKEFSVLFSVFACLHSHSAKAIVAANGMALLYPF